MRVPMLTGGPLGRVPAAHRMGSPSSPGWLFSLIGEGGPGEARGRNYSQPSRDAGNVKWTLVGIFELPWSRPKGELQAADPPLLSGDTSFVPSASAERPLGAGHRDTGGSHARSAEAGLCHGTDTVQCPRDPRLGRPGSGASSQPEAVRGAVIRSTGRVCAQLDFRAVRSRTSSFTSSFSFPTRKIGIINATRQGSWERQMSRRVESAWHTAS